MQLELREQRLAVDSILRGALGVVETSRVNETADESPQPVNALLNALLQSLFSRSTATHLSFLLVGQHAIHPLSTRCRVLNVKTLLSSLPGKFGLIGSAPGDKINLS